MNADEKIIQTHELQNLSRPYKREPRLIWLSTISRATFKLCCTNPNTCVCIPDRSTDTFEVVGHLPSSYALEDGEKQELMELAIRCESAAHD